MVLFVGVTGSRNTGETGGVVSTVTVRTSEGMEIFPAISACTAAMLCSPSLREMTAEKKSDTATVSPDMGMPLSYNCTVAPSSPDPMILRPDVCWVRLSVLLIPESLAGNRESREGGKTSLSTVTFRGGDASDLFPAMSVCTAVMMWAPFVRDMSMEKTPPDTMQDAPGILPPLLYNCTVTPLLPDPVIVRPEVLRVTSSLLLLPVSSSDDRARFSGGFMRIVNCPCVASQERYVRGMILMTHFSDTYPVTVHS